jgi:hypothetical protein
MKNKKIINEIKRIHGIMGLLIEEKIFPKLMSLADEITKGLKTLIKKPSLELGEDIELLEKISKGLIKTTDEDFVKLLSRLIESDEKIAKYLIPKILSNLDLATQEFLKQWKKQILKYAQKNPKNKDKVLQYIDFFVDKSGKIKTKIPQILDFIKKEMKEYTESVYMSASERLKSNAQKGFKQGWNSESGGILSIKGFRNALTSQKIQKFFNDWFGWKFSKLTDKERDIIMKWMKWGVPDTPSLKKSFQSLGFVGGSFNFTAQLVRKWIWVSGFITILKFVRDYTVDLWKPGNEYENWNYFSIFLHRFIRALTLTPFGFISPMIKIIEFVGKIIFVGLPGGWSAVKDEMTSYLLGENEKNVPKPPSNWNLNELGKKMIENLNNGIEDGKNKVDQLEKGNNIDTSDLIPKEWVSRDSLENKIKNLENTGSNGTDPILDKFKEYLKKLGYEKSQRDQSKKINDNKYQGPDEYIYNYNGTTFEIEPKPQNP